MNKIKLTILSVLAILNLGAFLLPATTVMAVDCNNPASVSEQLQCGAAQAGNNGTVQDASTSTNNINNDIMLTINILSVIVGIIAVVMIIVAGFRYITSAGDTNKVASAKSTITYAIIGLVIVALAQLIVRVTLNVVVNPTASGGSNGSNSSNTGSNNSNGGSSSSPTSTSNLN